jgi:hypothetical protein
MKAEAAILKSLVSPVKVLLDVTQLSKLLPGVVTAGKRLVLGPTAPAQAQHYDTRVSAAAELATALPSAAGSSSSSSTASAASSSVQAGTAEAAAADQSVLLLVGRVLYTAGQALLEVHASPAAGSAAVAAATGGDVGSSGWFALDPGQADWMQLLGSGALTAGLAGPLHSCVVFATPALQRAAADLAGASSSGGSSSRSSGSRRSRSSHTAALQQSLSELLQLRQDLQAALHAASVNAHKATAPYSAAAAADASMLLGMTSCSVDDMRNIMLGGSSSSSRRAAATLSKEDHAMAAVAEVELKANLTAHIAQQLVDLGTGICVHLTAGQHWCCANPGCTNLADALERQLVAGKGTVCSACRSVRLCGPACNKAYWKAGHKQVCALFKQRKSQQG